MTNIMETAGRRLQSLLEFDIDDVPWKDDLITEPLEIEKGTFKYPQAQVGEPFYMKE